MSGIIPTIGAGGVSVRDVNGVCDIPPSMQNAYCPPASFVTSCLVRYLPSDCTGKITPAQINAFQSELLCLAATWDPDGIWNCDSLCNLSTMFQAWAAANVGGAQGGNGITITTAAPFGIIPVGVAEALCETDPARQVLVDCIVSGDAGNQIVQGTDNRLFVAAQGGGDEGVGDGVTISVASPYSVIPAGVVAAICASNTARDALSECLISGSPDNQLTLGLDGQLFVPPVDGGVGDGLTITAAAPFAVMPLGSATAIAGSTDAMEVLVDSSISADADNQLTEGTDGLLFVPAPPIPPAPPEGDGVTITTASPFAVIPEGVVDAVLGSPTAPAVLAAGLLSTDADNQAVAGTDGLVFVPPVAIPPTPEGDGDTISLAAPYSLLPQGAVSAICADDDAADALAACLISGDADNLLSVGADGRLSVHPGAVLNGSAQYQYPPATIPETVGAAVVHGSNTFNIPNPTSQPIDVMVVVGANLGMIRDQSDVNSTVQIFANLYSGPLPSGTAISSLSNIEQVSATDNLLRHTTGTYRAGAIVTIPPGGLDVTSALLYTNAQGSTAFLQATQHSIAWYGVGGTLPSAPAFDPDAAVTAICGDDSAGDALAACLISTDTDNQAVQGTDGRLFVPPAPPPLDPAEGDGDTISLAAPYSLLPQGAVSAICADDDAADALAACLISGEPNNQLEQAGDGRLFVGAAGQLPPFAMASNPVAPPTTSGAPTDSPWRVNTASPFGRTLWYWNGASWVVAAIHGFGLNSHQLTTMSDLNPVPGTPGPAEVLHTGSTIFVPNAASTTFFALVTYSASAKLMRALAADVGFVELIFQLREGAVVGSGTLLCESRISFGNENIGGIEYTGVRQGADPVASTGASASIAVPFGGITLNSSVRYTNPDAATAIARFMNTDCRWYTPGYQ